MSDGISIRLQNIQAKLPNGRVLFKINRLNVEPGAQILIRGPSGSGKTTLLHLLAGLFIPSEGELFWNDSKLSVMSDAARAQFRRSNIGIIFQKLNLLSHLTGVENVQLGKSIDKNAALEALQVLGLKERAYVLTGKLSLGEQQRVAVARILASHPLLVLADEPTSSLDDENAEVLIKNIKKTQATLIVVSHDNRVANQFKQVINMADIK